MNHLVETITRIGQKIQVLLKRHEQLQREYDKLQQELRHRNQQLLEHQNSLQLLEDQLAALQATNQKPIEEKEKKLLEKKINGFIKDIDRVIAQLHNTDSEA